MCSSPRRWFWERKLGIEPALLYEVLHASSARSNTLERVVPNHFLPGNYVPAIGAGDDDQGPRMRDRDSEVGRCADASRRPRAAMLHRGGRASVTGKRISRR